MHIVLAANAEADQPWVADAAADLATQTGATVAVVSVDELSEGARAALPRSVYLERAEAAADAALTRLGDKGVQATRTVLSGRALDRILEFADDQAADVIIVGSSTRGHLAERLLGSVPVGLVQQARKPVLVITHPSAS